MMIRRLATNLGLVALLACAPLALAAPAAHAELACESTPDDEQCVPTGDGGYDGPVIWIANQFQLQVEIPFVGDYYARKDGDWVTSFEASTLRQNLGYKNCSVAFVAYLIVCE